VPEKAEPGFVKVTKRIAMTTVRVAGLGVRISFGVLGAALALAGGVLTYPLGMFVIGIPLAALGIIGLYKSVFW
jgi:hypothetical protein